MKRCFVCQQDDATTSAMTDGVSTHLVCDTCRQLVTPLFYCHRSLAIAVMESARAVRGSSRVEVQP